MDAQPVATLSTYRRVERALARLEHDAARQPSLEELAAAAGLSPSHFQRVFAQWAGVSPKRFLQSITVAHARALLRDSRPVLDAAFESGLSGPGRLHDLMVSVEAMTPGEYRQLGAGLVIRWATIETSFGPALVATTARGICALEFVSEGDTVEGALRRLEEHWPRADFVADAGSEVRGLARRVFAPVAERGGPLPLLLKGTNFQLQVWRALLRVPEGTLIDYGQLAARAGHPRAVRAVGSAVGANPISVLIPCHRVLRRHGELGGYRWGTARKLALLGHELSRGVEHGTERASGAN